MIEVLLLLATLAHGQEVSTDTVNNQGLFQDTKFINLRTAVRELESGRHRYPEPQTFAKGICFGNGQCQTSPGTGDSVKAATETWSGAKTSLSTFTIGPSVYTTTISYASIIVGGFSLCASTRPGGSSAISFTNFYSSFTYEVEYNLQQNTAVGLPRLTVNRDTGNNYKWETQNVVSSNASGTSGGNADSGFQIQRNQTAAGSIGTGSIYLASGYTQSHVVTIRWLTTAQIDATNSDAAYGGGRYVGTAPFTELQMVDNGGTWSGWVNIYCRYVGVAP